MSLPPAIRGRPIRRSLAVTAFLLLGSAAPRALGAQTILNVERLQPRETHGWHVGVEGSLTTPGGSHDCSRSTSSSSRRTTPDDLGDARTLADLSVLIAVTEQVDLAVRFQWRHDTRPPGGVIADDFAFTSGFTVSLR